MYRGFKNLRDCVYHSPLSLANMSSKQKQIAGSYLPFSTGIEIECSPKHSQVRAIGKVGIEKSFTSSKYSPMSFNIQDITELDFRIQPGINGLLSLSVVCDKLKEHFSLNPKSGIHYHVDFSQYYHLLRARNGNMFIDDMRMAEKIFLKGLDTWNYKGSYNKRNVSCFKGDWVRFCLKYTTIEFRIGEMSFDYEVLAKRIIHCNSMVIKFIKYLQIKNSN